MTRPTLKNVLLGWYRDRQANRFVPIDYLDDYEALVAFTDGFFVALCGQPEPSWDAFCLWLSRRGIVKGSEGWRLAIPRLAEKEARAPAQLLFELLELFDREQQLR